MTRRTDRNVPLLRRAPIANAAFSSLCALTFLVASAFVADLVGTSRADILSTGVSLVVFVAMVVTVLTRPDATRRWVIVLAVVIAGLEVLWVLTTPVKIAPFAPAGQWIFGVIGLVVATFAVVQIRALYGIFVELRQKGTPTRPVQDLR
jgi:ABC-type uncharacterized transport system permease subunit